MWKRSSAPKDKTAIELGGECDCATAQEFLEKLSPLHAFWTNSPDRWVFRGIDDEKHKLVAKADRPGAYEPYRVHLGPISFGTRDDAMQALLDRFRELLDRSGLTIPTLALDSTRNGMVVHGWIEPTHIPLMALAQHLGLPTQLLDWTQQAKTAAYFAAEPATRSESKDGRLAVWAIRRELGNQLKVKTGSLEHTALEAVVPRTTATLTFETAPRVSNPNLHAQSGLFTRLHGEKAHAMCLEDYLQLVDQQCLPSVVACPRPYARRLTAPRSCAPTLLRLLSYQGVEGSSMFPGFDGVVRSLQEAGRWDTPLKDIEP